MSEKFVRTPKLKTLFRLQFEHAQQCYVLLFPEGMIKLNPSAAEILTCIDGKKTDAEICELLRENFPDAPEDLEEDVREFLTHAEEKRWILYDA